MLVSQKKIKLKDYPNNFIQKDYQNEKKLSNNEL